MQQMLVGKVQKTFLTAAVGNLNMNFHLVPEETVQKGCGASSAADLQNLAGQGPEGPDLI